MRRAPALAVLAITGLLAGCSSSADQPRSAASPAAGPSSPAASSTPPPKPPHLTVRRLAWRLPEPLAREAVVDTGARRVVVAGGLLAGDTSAAASYTLDLGTGRHTALPDLPVPVHDTAGAFVGGHALVVGGGNASEQPVVQSRQGAGWQVLGRLPSGRSDLSTATVGGTAYVLGGYDGVSPALGDVRASTTGRHWHVVGRLAEPVRYAATAVEGGAVWVFGGERSNAMLDAVQRFDPATGTTKIVARLPRRLGHAAAVPFGKRILLVGGRVSSNVATDRMWWFDPATRKFTSAGRLPAPLADTAVLVRGSSAWLVGGESGAAPVLTDRVTRLTYR